MVGAGLLRFPPILGRYSVGIDRKYGRCRLTPLHVRRERPNAVNLGDSGADGMGLRMRNSVLSLGVVLAVLCAFQPAWAAADGVQSGQQLSRAGRPVVVSAAHRSGVSPRPAPFHSFTPTASVACFADPYQPQYSPEFAIAALGYFDCQGLVSIYSFSLNLWRRNSNGSYSKVGHWGAIAPGYPTFREADDSCVRGSIYGYHTEAIATWYDGVSWHTDDANSAAVFITCG